MIALFFATFLPVLAQNPETKSIPLIADILILGNEKTRDYVILREMSSLVGQSLNLEQVERDRQRIQNLNLFTKVVIEVVDSGNGVALLVMVAERWFVFPYPIYFFSDRDLKKLSLGAGVVHQNVKGTATSVGIMGWTGYKTGVRFYSKNPYLHYDKNLYSTMSIFSTQIFNRLPEYEEFESKYRGATFSLGKRWGFNTFTSLTAGFSQIVFPEKYKFLSISNAKTDDLPALGFSFKYDNRDLREYPKSGAYIQIAVDKIVNPGKIDYTLINFDNRIYIPIVKQLSLATRFALDVVRGDTPGYAQLYLGYGERVRGYFSEQRFGDNRLLMSAEFRFPLMPIQYIELDKSGFLGGYGNDLPFGLSAALFYDTAAMWRKYDPLKKESFLSGFGVGLHIHLPYIELFRLELAMNDLGEYEYIADIGVYF